MPNAPTYPLDIGPSSYWDLTNPVAAIIGNVKGDLRRTMIADVLAPDEQGEHYRSLLGDLDSDLFDETRHSPLEQIDPRWMGGEYLPDYLPGEVEIARLVLESTTRDVYSVRARRSARPAARIRYRMVDEYAGVWRVRPRLSDLPLTMGELVEMIDGATADGADWTDLTDALRDGTLDGSGDVDDAARFVSVSSYHYPALGAYYAHKAARWAARQRQRSASKSYEGK
jgi:hypothetical protein